MPLPFYTAAGHNSTKASVTETHKSSDTPFDSPSSLSTFSRFFSPSGTALMSKLHQCKVPAQDFPCLVKVLTNALHDGIWLSFIAGLYHMKAKQEHFLVCSSPCVSFMFLWCLTGARKS